MSGTGAGMNKRPIPRILHGPKFTNITDQVGAINTCDAAGIGRDCFEGLLHIAAMDIENVSVCCVRQQSVIGH